jgi:hypothetical protein
MEKISNSYQVSLSSNMYGRKRADLEFSLLRDAGRSLNLLLPVFWGK